MTLQEAIDQTRLILRDTFVPRAFKHTGHMENYCKREIKRAFMEADIDAESREYFGNSPFYEMVENAFIFRAMLQCIV